MHGLTPLSSVANFDNMTVSQSAIGKRSCFVPISHAVAGGKLSARGQALEASMSVVQCPGYKLWGRETRAPNTNSRLKSNVVNPHSTEIGPRIAMVSPSGGHGTNTRHIGTMAIPMLKYAPNTHNMGRCRPPLVHRTPYMIFDRKRAIPSCIDPTGRIRGGQGKGGGSGDHTHINNTARASRRKRQTWYTN